MESNNESINKGGFLKKCLYAFLIISVIGTAFSTFSRRKQVTTQYPDPTRFFYIEDYSGVFTENTEEYIMEQAVELQKATKAQIVVAAIPDTQEDSLEQYSYELAKKWGIGDEKLDNGVLILFTTTDPHVRIEVGKGLEGCLPDAKCGRILDTWAVKAKDNNGWNEAAVNTWVATAQEVYKEYGIDEPDTLTTVAKADENVTGQTFADASFPGVKVTKNTNPIWLQIISAFFVFWIGSFFPFLLICLLIFRSVNRASLYKQPGGWWMYGGGIGPRGGGGGFTGGGGGFGGGGASR